MTRRTRGLAWALLMASLQAMSGFATYLGVRLAWEPVPAAILAAALQASAFWAAFRFINSDEPGRRAWLRVVLPAMGISIFFSFAGLSYEHENRSRLADGPSRARDELRSAAHDLASQVTEAKTLALRWIANEERYVQIRLAKAREKLAAGAYTSPADATAFVTAQEALLDQLLNEKSSWESARVDVQHAIELGPRAGYDYLSERHSLLAGLVGRLPPSARVGFHVGDPPAPPPEVFGQPRPPRFIEGTFGRLFSVSGIVWLLIALTLDFVPLLAAMADGHAAGGSSARSSPLYVLPRTEQSAILADEGTELAEALRVVCQVGAASARELERTVPAANWILESYRMIMLCALAEPVVKQHLEVRRRRFRLLEGHLKDFGASAQHLDRLRAAFVEELLSAGISDAQCLRLLPIPDPATTKAPTLVPGHGAQP